MREVWKNITDYEGYQVSNLGRVRTFNKTTYTERHGIRHWKNIILKERIDKKNKMLSVQLYKNGKGKSFLIHRLVAQEFLDCPANKKMTVNHKDGNRLNNNVNNLEWLSLGDNIRHGFKTGLYHNQKSIEIINKKDLSINKFMSLTQASIFINKSHAYISDRIKKGVFENKNYKWNIISN